MYFLGIVLPDPVFVVVAFFFAVTLLIHLTLSIGDRREQASGVSVLHPDVRAWMQLHSIDHGRPTAASVFRTTPGLTVAWSMLLAFAIVAVVAYASATGELSAA